MNYSIKNPLVMMLYCFMSGLFVAISFIETPLKFQVPGMTLPVALNLGKIMFGVSMKIQIGIMIFIFLLTFYSKKAHTRWDYPVAIGLLAILMLQQFWMFPILSDRVTAISLGKPSAPSPIHHCYIATEVLKTIFLILAIRLQFKKFNSIN